MKKKKQRTTHKYTYVRARTLAKLLYYLHYRLGVKQKLLALQFKLPIYILSETLNGLHFKKYSHFENDNRRADFLQLQYEIDQLARFINMSKSNPSRVNPEKH